MVWRTWPLWAAWRKRNWRMTPAVAALLFGGCTGGLTSWIPGRGMLHNSNCNPLYCREVDDCVTAHRARMLARESLECMSHQQHCGVSCDYVYGYEQAFVDVAQGGWGVTPAVPPRRYWGLCSRTPEGKQRACDWFAGYAAGAEQAKAMLGDEGVIASSFRCGGACGNGACGPAACDTGGY